MQINGSVDIEKGFTNSYGMLFEQSFGMFLLCGIDWMTELQLRLNPYGPDGPMLVDRPSVLHINSKEPWNFAEVPGGPQTYTLNILWIQKEGAQIGMSEWSQSFTFT